MNDNIFNKILLKCPSKQQEFMWVADYGKDYLSQYNYSNIAEHKFKEINRLNLECFGMVGLGHKFFYHAFGGLMVINGLVYDLEFISKDNTKYELTGQPVKYDDPIFYRDCEAYVNFNKTAQKSFIYQYNFGYKTNIFIKDIKFSFQNLFCLPVDGRDGFFNYRLTSNKDIEGTLIIKKNGIAVAESECKLEKDISKELNWVLK